MAPQSNVARTIHVKFEINYAENRIKSPYNLAVIGSIEQLGKWKESECLLAKEVEPGKWVMDLDMQKHNVFQWRWIVVSADESKTVLATECETRNVTLGHYDCAFFVPKWGQSEEVSVKFPEKVICETSKTTEATSKRPTAEITWARREDKEAATNVDAIDSVRQKHQRKGIPPKVGPKPKKNSSHDLLGEKQSQSLSDLNAASNEGKQLKRPGKEHCPERITHSTSAPLSHVPQLELSEKIPTQSKNDRKSVVSDNTTLKNLEANTDHNDELKNEVQVPAVSPLCVDEIQSVETEQNSANAVPGFGDKNIDTNSQLENLNEINVRQPHDENNEAKHNGMAEKDNNTRQDNAVVKANDEKSPSLKSPDSANSRKDLTVTFHESCSDLRKQNDIDDARSDADVLSNILDSTFAEISQVVDVSEQDSMCKPSASNQCATRPSDIPSLPSEVESADLMKKSDVGKSALVLETPTSSLIIPTIVINQGLDADTLEPVPKIREINDDEDLKDQRTLEKETYVKDMDTPPETKLSDTIEKLGLSTKVKSNTKKSRKVDASDSKCPNVATDRFAREKHKHSHCKEIKVDSTRVDAEMCSSGRNKTEHDVYRKSKSGREKSTDGPERECKTKEGVDEKENKKHRKYKNSFQRIHKHSPSDKIAKNTDTCKQEKYDNERNKEINCDKESSRLLEKNAKNISQEIDQNRSEPSNAIKLGENEQHPKKTESNEFARDVDRENSKREDEEKKSNYKHDEKAKSPLGDDFARQAECDKNPSTKRQNMEFDDCDLSHTNNKFQRLSGNEAVIIRDRHTKSPDGAEKSGDVIEKGDCENYNIERKNASMQNIVACDVSRAHRGVFIDTSHQVADGTSSEPAGDEVGLTLNTQPEEECSCDRKSNVMTQYNNSQSIKTEATARSDEIKPKQYDLSHNSEDVTTAISKVECETNILDTSDELRCRPSSSNDSRATTYSSSKSADDMIAKAEGVLFRAMRVIQEAEANKDARKSTLKVADGDLDSSSKSKMNIVGNCSDADINTKTRYSASRLNKLSSEAHEHGSILSTKDSDFRVGQSDEETNACNTTQSIVHADVTTEQTRENSNRTHTEERHSKYLETHTDEPMDKKNQLKKDGLVDLEVASCTDASLLKSSSNSRKSKDAQNINSAQTGKMKNIIEEKRKNFVIYSHEEKEAAKKMIKNAIDEHENIKFKNKISQKSPDQSKSGCEMPTEIPSSKKDNVENDETSIQKVNVLVTEFCKREIDRNKRIYRGKVTDMKIPANTGESLNPTASSKSPKTVSRTIPKTSAKSCKDNDDIFEVSTGTITQSSPKSADEHNINSEIKVSLGNLREERSVVVAHNIGATVGDEVLVNHITRQSHTIEEKAEYRKFSDEIKNQDDDRDVNPEIKCPIDISKSPERQDKTKKTHYLSWCIPSRKHDDPYSKANDKDGNDDNFRDESRSNKTAICDIQDGFLGSGEDTAFQSTYCRDACLINAKAKPRNRSSSIDRIRQRFSRAFSSGENKKKETMRDRSPSTNREKPKQPTTMSPERSLETEIPPAVYPIRHTSNTQTINCKETSTQERTRPFRLYVGIASHGSDEGNDEYVRHYRSHSPEIGKSVENSDSVQVKREGNLTKRMDIEVNNATDIADVKSSIETTLTVPLSASKTNAPNSCTKLTKTTKIVQNQNIDAIPMQSPKMAPEYDIKSVQQTCLDELKQNNRFLESQQTELLQTHESHIEDRNTSVLPQNEECTFTRSAFADRIRNKYSSIAIGPIKFGSRNQEATVDNKSNVSDTTSEQDSVNTETRTTTTQLSTEESSDITLCSYDGKIMTPKFDQSHTGYKFDSFMSTEDQSVDERLERVYNQNFRRMSNSDKEITKEQPREEAESLLNGKSVKEHVRDVQLSVLQAESQYVPHRKATKQSLNTKEQSANIEKATELDIHNNFTISGNDRYASVKKSDHSEKKTRKIKLKKSKRQRETSDEKEISRTDRNEGKIRSKNRSGHVKQELKNDYHSIKCDSHTEGRFENDVNEIIQDTEDDYKCIGFVTDIQRQNPREFMVMQNDRFSMDVSDYGNVGFEKSVKSADYIGDEIVELNFPMENQRLGRVDTCRLNTSAGLWQPETEIEVDYAQEASESILDCETLQEKAIYEEMYATIEKDKAVVQPKPKLSKAEPVLSKMPEPVFKNGILSVLGVFVNPNRIF